jgi:nucleoside-diphosphate-sugar epimerase
LIVRTAALAGATGFLGQRLTSALLARGWSVRALARRADGAAKLARDGVTPVLGDLADIDALRSLTAGADVVINCAGLIKARHAAQFFEVNRDGAARLAAASSGRIVLVSSLAAREPGLSAYAASKRAGEEAVREAAGDRVTIIRPPVIYGPGDRETLALFRVMARAPVAPVPADRAARLALAHVDDVADAIVALIETPAQAGRFAVGGDRPDGYGWREIMEEAARAVGRTPWLAPVPAWAVFAAASVSEAIGVLTAKAPIFTRGKAREMRHADWSVGQSELAPDAPAARFSLSTGFADTVAWYRRAGWL